MRNDTAALPPEPPNPAPKLALVLGPEMTIAHAGGCHAALAEALLSAPAALALDLGGVTDFDSSGVQLLLATQRSLAERGDALHLVAASPAVVDALTIFGLRDLLGAPHLASVASVASVAAVATVRA
jgi:anti-anti-sigma factor